MKGTTFQLEPIKEDDDSLVLFSKQIGDKHYAIIPKSRVIVSETPTSYVIEYTYN